MSTRSKLAFFQGGQRFLAVGHHFPREPELLQEARGDALVDRMVLGHQHAQTHGDAARLGVRLVRARRVGQRPAQDLGDAPVQVLTLDRLGERGLAAFPGDAGGRAELVHRREHDQRQRAETLGPDRLQGLEGVHQAQVAQHDVEGALRTHRVHDL